MSATLTQQFDKERDKILKIAVKGSEKIVKKAVSAGVRSMIYNSPVWTSAYVLSHRVSLGDVPPEPPTEKMPWVRASDPWSPKTENLNKMLGIIKQFKLGQKIRVSNHIAHAKTVEFGGGNTPPYSVYKKGLNAIIRHLNNAKDIK